MSRSPSEAPPSFVQAELQQALTEQSFGIKGFKLTEASDHEASAEVSLLEGHTIKLSLTNRGFQLHSIDGPGCEVYETVEAALSVASSMYVKAKEKALAEKLAAFSAQQD